MKTHAQIREIITIKARRAAGVSTREARDSFQPESREAALAIVGAMLAAGELFECLRPSGRGGRPQRRLFVERGDGSKWSAGMVQEPLKARRPNKPQPVRLDPGQCVAGAAPEPFICPVGTDHRYSVKDLPQGYRSALNPNECRPWASVAAAARVAS